MCTLEKMDKFFEKRLSGYDEHMRECIEGADEFYHYDTPLTAEHETEILLKAGFLDVKTLNSWGATCTLKATR